MTEILPKKGDIYWADLNPGTGSEQTGYRPVVIVSNNLANQKSPIISIVPMTRKAGKAKVDNLNILCVVDDCTIDKSAIALLRKDGHSYLHTDSIIITNQAKACSRERLIAKIGYINKTEIVVNIEKGLSLVFGINACQVCGYPAFEHKKMCINKDCRAVLRRECKHCKNLINLKYKFCPHCGKGV